MTAQQLVGSILRTERRRKALPNRSEVAYNGTDYGGNQTVNDARVENRR
jgi:hypothetical protein